MRKLRFKGCIIFIILLCSPLSTLAQSAPTEQDVKAYIDKMLTKSESKTGEVSKVNLDSPRTLPHQGGNDVFDIFLKMEEDHLQQGIDFYFRGGMRWAIVGLCIRCRTFGCSFYPYQRYHFPNEMVEIGGTLQGEYSIDLILELYELLLEEFGYDAVAALTPLEIVRALTAGISLGGIGSIPSSPPTPNIDIVKDADDRLRLTGHYRDSTAMARHTHFFSTMSMMTGVPFAPLGNCHDRPPVMFPTFYRTDSILYHIITTSGFLSHFLNPAESTFMLLNPGACVGHNIASGLTPKGSPFNAISGSAKQPALCIPGLPAQYPAGQRLRNVRSSPNALQGALMPANHAFRVMNKQVKSDYAYSSHGNISADTVQWRQPSAIKCGPRGQLGDNVDFRKKGYDASDVRADPDRAVATLWKFMRCCPRRYRVLFGPRPQRKGMEDFKGSKL